MPTLRAVVPPPRAPPLVHTRGRLGHPTPYYLDVEPDPSNDFSHDLPTEPETHKISLSAVSPEAATVIVESDAVMRDRLETEMLLVLRSALGKMGPRPPDRGAIVRWLMVGVCAGAMFVYVLMASALHQKEASFAQLYARSLPAPPATTSLLAPPPLACPAPMGDAIVNAIPTFDVDQLPRAATTNARRSAPKKSAPTSTAAQTNVDDENPYDGVTQ